MLFLDKNIDLNPTELEIYHYIVANANKVVFMRIRELAQFTHVSTSTILRFCRKFNCQGFPEFKIRLQYYLDDIKKHKEPIQKYDETVFIDFLSKSMSKDFHQNIHDACEILLKSEFLFFTGNGISSIMAQYAANIFSSLHTFSLAITDPVNFPIYTLPKYFNGKICLVVFSESGENSEVLEFMERFRVHDIQIISITNSSSSKIAQLSDMNISYYIQEEIYQDSNVTSQLPVISIIENLAKTTFYMKS